MYFLQYDCRPGPGAICDEGVIGAFVNAWIIAKSQESAEEHAEMLIQEQGWRILSKCESKLVTESDYEEGQDGKEFFDQAVLDGEVYVFHTWSEDDGDDLH